MMHSHCESSHSLLFPLFFNPHHHRHICSAQRVHLLDKAVGSILREHLGDWQKINILAAVLTSARHTEGTTAQCRFTIFFSKCNALRKCASFVVEILQEGSTFVLKRQLMTHKLIVKKRIVQCGEIIDPSSKVGPLPPLPIIGNHPIGLPLFCNGPIARLHSLTSTLT